MGISNSKFRLTILFIVAGFITLASEKVGVINVTTWGVKLSLLPMLYAVIIGMLVTPDILDNVIKPLGKVLNHEVIKVTGNVVMISL
jgi:hypothetical protein